MTREQGTNMCSPIPAFLWHGADDSREHWPADEQRGF